MKKLTIKQALNGCNAEFPVGIDTNKHVTLALPDETLSEDSLVFFTERLHKSADALKPRLNGNKPYAVVAGTNQRVIDSPAPIIRVDSVRKAFAYACSNLYDIDYKKLKIIGVTGTNGKTSTASIIFEILKNVGYSVGFIGTGKICINDQTVTDITYSMTTPDPTLLYNSLSKMNKAGCEYVVMEVSSHSIALNKIAPIEFEYSIFTNLNDEHMDFHRDIEEYYQTKLLLFKQTKKGLFNMDDSYSRRAYTEAKCEKSSIGIVQSGDAYATDVSIKSPFETFFYYREPNFTFGIKSRLGGAFNVYNMMCALKCVIDLGVKPCIAKRALEEIKQIEGRLQFISSDVYALIDYAHTPQALYNLLKTLVCSDIYKQNLTLVFGCGGNRDKKKRESMGKIAATYANKIILTEDNNRDELFSDIISDIARGIDCNEYRVIRDRESAIRSAISEARTGEIIAIVGKGHEKYKIERGSTTYFDEEAITKDALSKRSCEYANKA